MNTLFFILWGLSLIAITVFIALAAFKYLKKDKVQGKKQLRNTGVSVIIMLASLAMFISTTEPSETEGSQEDEVAATSISANEEKNIERSEESKKTPNVVKVEPVNEESKETVKEAKIETSVFKYAKSVDVTDAREINKHITLKIDLNDDAKAGMGTQHVLNQMYDFLQQEGIQGADTVTYFVRVKEEKVAQFTTTVANFKPDSEKPMASLVLEASEVEQLNSEVEAFGKATGLW